MHLVNFLVLFLTAISKTGCSPVLPTKSILTSANCLLDYCCTLFESMVVQTQGEGLMDHVDDPTHLPKRSLFTLSEGRVSCKGSMHDMLRKPQNSQLLCRRLYDQRNHGQQTLCRFSANRRPQEDVLMTRRAAMGSQRFYRTKPPTVGKLLTQRPIATRRKPLMVDSKRETSKSSDSLTAVSGNGEKVTDVLAVYRMWRDANGYGKQNARWGRSSNGHIWSSAGRRESDKQRQNGATKDDPVYSRFSHERREISNSTGKGSMQSTFKDKPESDAMQRPHLASNNEVSTSEVEAGGGEHNKTGNVIRTKRIYLDGSPRLSSAGEDFSPEMREVLEGYLDWRSKYGYGRLSGRWG